MRRTLPPRVYLKDGSYWHVASLGTKRIWTKLCREREGLPAMYTALAALTADKALDDMMPKLCADWMLEVAVSHSAKTQTDDRFRNREISEAFAEFRANQVKPPDVVDFLKRFKTTPRTFNAYRAAVRELMRYAEEKGFREPGSNPTASIKTMKTPARSRYITDSELRRIKVAAMYGKDGKLTRSGPVICALIDLAYLTGQRIGDLLTLEWSAIGTEGIDFTPKKVQHSTKARVLIEWSPKLRAVIDRLKAMKKRNIKFVITTQEGQPYKYHGAGIAWTRALERAGIDCHFHDLRAKALTDKDRAEGMGSARTMGGHATEAQTSAYVRHKTAKKTGATR
ncbi:tyrosine-type recombinase/integrase [Variovorax sp. PAMC 28711]|uniref:tyrosine-type recombinase/integrase n=1 Tax=Variovorax sp. PAMC 28711 TaxID=1795631 RepID=UPI00078C94E5|nr:tyrosine-type recombinase/integrase [Variovorax sp. PAMC 28711]AMM23030.1 integrase [Variovorax sp. PAMC 28711]